MTHEEVQEAARRAVRTWSEAKAGGDDGALFSLHDVAMAALAALLPVECASGRCRLGGLVYPGQVQVAGRHLLCAVHDHSVRIECSRCFDGRIHPLGSVGDRCPECGARVPL